MLIKYSATITSTYIHETPPLVEKGSITRGGFLHNTREIKLTPPLKVRADQILDSGFYFFQKSQQSQNGVLFFPEISAIFLFFFRKSHQFCGTFWTPFWTSFLAFFPCKTPKTPQNFFARFARRVHFFSAISNPGFIFSRNLSNLRFGVLFFPEISPMFQIRVLLRGGVLILSLW